MHLLLALAVLLFVMLIGNLIKIADLVVNKGVDIISVTKLFVYLIPYLLTYTLPISVLCAVLLSLGRLSGDNEIIAMRASGINILHFLIPLIIIGLILSLLLVIFNDNIIASAHFATRKTLTEVGIKNPTAYLEPGVFIHSFAGYVLFIYRIEGNKLFNIRIYEPLKNKTARTIIAKRGEFIPLPEEKKIKLKLMYGSSDEPDPGNPGNFYKLNFKTYFMTLNLSEVRKEKIEKKPKDMTFKELNSQIRKLKSQGIHPLPLLTQIHKRLALAFSCLVFIILGIPLAQLTRRREKSINFGLAFLVVGLYYILLVAAEALSLQGKVLPQIAMWTPNIIFAFLGLILTRRICAY
jgi:lipopolysaccharide export system permease protein